MEGNSNLLYNCCFVSAEVILSSPYPTLQCHFPQEKTRLQSKQPKLHSYLTIVRLKPTNKTESYM